MKLMTPAEAGELLGLSMYHVAHLMDRGVLKSVVVGRGGTKKHRRTSADWVDEFRRGQTVGNADHQSATRSKADGKCPVIGLQFSGPPLVVLNGRSG